MKIYKRLASKIVNSQNIKLVSIFIYSDQNVFMVCAVTPLQYTVLITEDRFSSLHSRYEFFSSYHLTC